jgi:hypothetical protein
MQIWHNNSRVFLKKIIAMNQEGKKNNTKTTKTDTLWLQWKKKTKLDLPPRVEGKKLSSLNCQ